jgi:hypothetical protein
MKGNHLIDSDSGQHQFSPYYTGNNEVEDDRLLCFYCQEPINNEDLEKTTVLILGRNYSVNTHINCNKKK